MNDPGEGLDLQLQIRGYVDKAPEKPVKIEATDEPEGDADIDRDPPSAIHAISDHLFGVLRGSNNLVFGGSRRTVETLADALRSKSERAGVPNEFYPHHGNLSKELREELEKRLKTGDLPTTAVCTTTLELGIDIGSVKSIGQIGAPRSICSLRQRLGRTGRREGVPSVLRIYVIEPECDPKCDLLDELQFNVVRAVAAIRLLARRFVEPTSSSDTLATALLHQTLSVIAERGGAKADAIFKLLGGPGLFAAVDTQGLRRICFGTQHAPNFRSSSRRPTGTLMLGEQGERLVLARDFYAMFQGTRNGVWSFGSKTLGTMPLLQPRYQGKPRRIRPAGDGRSSLSTRSRTSWKSLRTRVVRYRISRGRAWEGCARRLAAGDAARLRIGRRPVYLDEAKVLLLKARDAYRKGRPCPRERP